MSYLLAVTSNGPLAAAAAVAAPDDAVVEWCESGAPVEGLEHWDLVVTVAGALGTWVAGAAYERFWEYLARLLAAQPARPQGRLTIASRSDPHRVVAAFHYFGPQELKRGAADLRARVAPLVDRASQRLTRDVELVVHP
jgi:hypothetical protein